VYRPAGKRMNAQAYVWPRAPTATGDPSLTGCKLTRMEPQPSPLMTSPAAARSPISPPTRFFGISLFVLMIVAVGSMLLSTHVPSPLGSQLALFIAAALALGVLIQCRPGATFSGSNPRFQSVAQKSWLLRSPWLRVPLLTLFVFVITLSAIEDGVFAVVTAALGNPAVRALTVTGTSPRGRYSCAHFDVREVGWLLDRAFCASDDELRLANPGDTLLVYGKQSALGLNAERHVLSGSTSP
jgi:hypothetical protein